MKKKITHGIVLLLSFALAGCAVAEAASALNPWPTHAPEATPYVRVYDQENNAPVDEAVHFESMEALWSSIYEEFGHFYAKRDELEMFRSLPQDEPYDFVPHSVRFELDEGEAMRMARLFDALDGVDARVIAMHTLESGVPDWGFMTVVNMTPARLFALSEELDEHFMFEQFYESVRLRFDIDYWPDGLYDETEAALRDYERRGCFCFEADTLKALEGLSRDEKRSYALQVHTPDGWSEDGQQMMWILRGREGVMLSLAWRDGDGDRKTLCLADMSLETLSVLSDALPGRYLVRLADEALLRDYDGIVRFDPKTGEALPNE